MKLTPDHKTEIAEIIAAISVFQDGLASLSAGCDITINVLMEIRDTGTLTSRSMGHALPVLGSIGNFDTVAGGAAMERCEALLRKILS